jgi:hypothetical protein
MSTQAGLLFQPTTPALAAATISKMPLNPLLLPAAHNSTGSAINLPINEIYPLEFQKRSFFCVRQASRMLYRSHGDRQSGFVVLRTMAISMAGPSRVGSIPKLMAPIYENVVGLTDDVCERQLNSEYRDLARAMAAALCRKRPSPLRSGQPRTWACSIVYVLGRINFLGDPSFPPHMTTAELCAEFQVGESTVHAKARAIENALGIGPFDPQWMLRSLAERNPLVWMAEVNGLLVDLRDMPREVQEIAFEDGLIPYIPADRKIRS